MAVRTNLITNPSIETNTTGYTLQGAGTTLTRVSTQFKFGAWSLQVVAAAVTNAGVTSPAATVAASTFVAASLYIKGNAGTEAVTIELRNQANTVIATQSVTLTSGWLKYNLDGVTPVGTTSAHIRINRPGASPAQTYFVDGVIIRQTTDIDIDFFSGDTDDDLLITYAWTGTVNGSTSTATDNASITPAGLSDANPTPRVEITVPTWGGTVVTTTVERIAEGTRSVVRGALRELSPGGFFVVDYEAPIGVPLQYQATGYNSAGVPVVMTPESQTVTLTAAAPLNVWIHDPLSPLTAINLTLEAASGKSLTYAMDSAVLAPMGSSYPVAVSGTRRIASSVTVSVATYTNDQADDLRSVLLSAAVLVVRPADNNRLPLLSYLSAAQVVEGPIMGGVRRWEITGDTVRPPSADIAVPVHTWEEVLDLFTDWTGLMNANTTWAEVIKNPA